MAHIAQDNNGCTSSGMITTDRKRQVAWVRLCPDPADAEEYAEPTWRLLHALESVLYPLEEATHNHLRAEELILKLGHDDL
jgi:hypothetical protein